MSNSKLDSQRIRRALILRVVLIVLFAIIDVVAAAVGQLSSLGIYFISIGYSSVTLGINTTVNGSSAVAFTSTNFNIYGNNNNLLNASTSSIFPTSGPKSVDTTEFSIPYSIAGFFLTSYLLGGGHVRYEVIGRTSFYTPIGEADLPIDISTVTGSAVRGPSSFGLKMTTAVTNDPSLASFSRAKFQIYANGIDLVNGTADNSLPGANTPPKVSNVTTEISLPYSKIRAFLWSYFLGGERASFSVNGTVIFQTYITYSAEPVGEIALPFKINTITDSYGSLSSDLYYILIVIAVVGVVAYRKGYV